MLLRFAQDMFQGVSSEDIGVWPADDKSCVELKGAGPTG
jgi:hypothetical protein